MKSNITVGPARPFMNISILLESVLGAYEGPESPMRFNTSPMSCSTPIPQI